jgi:hypothetical protein
MFCKVLQWYRKTSGLSKGRYPTDIIVSCPLGLSKARRSALQPKVRAAEAAQRGSQLVRLLTALLNILIRFQTAKSRGAAAPLAASIRSRIQAAYLHNIGECLGCIADAAIL